MPSLTDKSQDAPFDNLNLVQLLGGIQPGPQESQPAISSPHEIEEGEYVPHSEEHEKLHRLLKIQPPIQRPPPTGKFRGVIPLFFRPEELHVIPAPIQRTVQRPVYTPPHFEMPEIIDFRKRGNIWGSDLFAQGKKRRRL